MNILENVSLENYSTMRLGGPARYLVEVTNQTDMLTAINWATDNQLAVIMIGDGSNIVWSDQGYPGLVIVNKTQGVEVTGEFDATTYITAASGENWDEFVKKTVDMGLTGIEYLSLVPGTVGATPVQNVGAYGTDVSATISTILAYDITLKQLVTLRGSECEFGYRTSRFKTSDRGRFFIVSVTFGLQKGNPTPPFYNALQSYLTEHGISETTPDVVRNAVIAIRSSKLPDPKVNANNGSFFANPIIDSYLLTELLDTYPTVPHWQMENDKVKISAARLIEQAGFKDFKDAETGMCTWPLQPLVLVNENAQSTAHLLAFKKKITDAVQQKFNITLIQEPELI